MKKIPISLIIDDPAPVISVYYTHNPLKHTLDGRPLPERVPNSFLRAFCDTVKKYGIRGKFSIVPCPGGKGDIVRGLPNVAQSEVDEWLNMAKEDLAPLFAFCPEILTHWGAIDLATGEMLDIQENDWSDSQDRTTMTPYIAKAFSILKEAGIDATGVTSPWDFGIHVEDEYAHAISQAMFEVYGRTDAWYFCRSLYGEANAKPWIAVNENGRRVVAIPGTIHDCIWKSMDTPDTSEELVQAIADEYITLDGKSGEIPHLLAVGSIPIITTHWQSLFSAGAGTGLRVLAEIGARVEKNLSDQVEWTRFDDLMRMTLNGEI